MTMPQTPERRKSYAKEYYSRPEVKARRTVTYKAWMERNREKKQALEARRRLERRASCLVATVRTRAAKRGLAFNLDEYIADLQHRIDAGVCEITGEKFDLSPGRKYNSPSLDRIDSSKGYTIDNVRVVLNLVNAAMGDWGEDRLKQVMTAWLAMQSSRKSRRRS